jgi:hypothetical protein
VCVLAWASGKREEAREMVAEIEKATASMPSPRKEQLNQVWVPLCKGTTTPTLLIYSYSYFLHIYVYLLHICIFFWMYVNNMMGCIAGIYAYETGHKEEGLKLLNEAHLDDHLHVRRPTTAMMMTMTTRLCSCVGSCRAVDVCAYIHNRSSAAPTSSERWCTTTTATLHSSNSSSTRTSRPSSSSSTLHLLQRDRVREMKT